jgi:hypothetical protein
MCPILKCKILNAVVCRISVGSTYIAISVGSTYIAIAIAGVGSTGERPVAGKPNNSMWHQSIISFI